MKRFDVLDRHLNIHQHYLLEASAGTGKTFSIQNIVVRLLMSEPATFVISSQETAERKGADVKDCDEGIALSLENILVVTFTRAATRDLQQRIRTHIETCLHFLMQRLNTGISSAAAPDYLQAVMEQEERVIMQAKRLLQQALFSFDQASIFTIHSFCSRMLSQYALESDSGFQAGEGVEPLPNSELRQLIHDFFRTEMRPEHYSPTQLAILLKEDPEQTKLLKALKSGHEFAPQPNYSALFESFKSAFLRLKAELGLHTAHLRADIDRLLPLFKQCKEISNEQKPLWLERFAVLWDQPTFELADFEWLLSEGLLWSCCFDPALLKAGKSWPEQLHYPTLSLALEQQLVPLIQQATDFSSLLTRVAQGCLQLLKRYQYQEERTSPDDLLSKMEQALRQPAFAALIRRNYQAAIIDEFQDTDPLQWKLFKRLFVPEEGSWTGYLYLVGDPKQSIYSFRQADIYTYLSAAQTLGSERCFTLNVNYRSQPQLVHALNALFDNARVPHWLSLPKQSSTSLYYQPVQAAIDEEDRSNKDATERISKKLALQNTHAAVHFCLYESSGKRVKLEEVEERLFFPFIVQQVERLRSLHRWHYRQFAVLVRDRHQASRFTQFLDGQRIPSLNQRGISLAESLALPSLVDLLRAILQPHQMGLLKVALGSRLLGWTCQELRTMESIDSVCLTLYQLRYTLLEKGFAAFFEELLESHWKADGLTLLHRLLRQPDGLEFYHDLQQISDLIITHHLNGWNQPEGLIAFLDSFKQWAIDEDERLLRLQDPNQDGIKIITLHYSKGLEFDVVFALGLAQRDYKKSDLIPVEHGERIIQTPLKQEDPLYQLHCEEVDAEKMRQLYVALTRAKYQLYIPAILGNPTPLAWGEASPLDLWMARFQQPAADYATLYSRIPQDNGRSLLSFLDTEGAQHGISYSLHTELTLPPLSPPMRTALTLLPPRRVQVTSTPLLITSFTSLNQARGTSENASILDADEELQPPHDFNPSHRSIHLLPASSSTGILIHQIMEKIDFNTWKNFKAAAEGADLISPFTQQTDFAGWESTLAEMVFQSLKCPLLPNGFTLADLPSHQLYREMEFLFPATELPGLSGTRLVKGVIDLIFCHEGKYYLLDWKSHWLGPHLDDYQAGRLKQVMQEHGYFLQAQLYSEALRRYLALVEQRPFEECFGGAIYLFVRGLNPHNSDGIFHVKENLCSAKA